MISCQNFVLTILRQSYVLIISDEICVSMTSFLSGVCPYNSLTNLCSHDSLPTHVLTTPHQCVLMIPHQRMASKLHPHDDSLSTLCPYDSYENDFVKIPARMMSL